MKKLLPVFFVFLIFLGCNDSSNIVSESVDEQNLETSSNPETLDSIVEPIIQKITANQLVQMLALDKAYLIDCRSVEDFNLKRIGNSIHLDNRDLPNVEIKLKNLDLQKTFYVYGRDEIETNKFGKWLIQQGINQVYILEGGIQAWENAQLPIIH